MQPDRFANATAARKIEDACTHFEEAWKSGHRQTIEELIQAEQEPTRSDLLRELLQLEWELRQDEGQHPTLSE